MSHHMGRPKTIKNGTKLNLYVPLAAKRHLYRLASAHRRSISAMVVELALAASVPSVTEPRKEAA